MYEPNFADPRVQRKLQNSFAFAISWLSAGGRPLGKAQIDSALGCSSHDLSKWLRELLLTCTNPRWNKDTGQTKRWAYKTTGVLWLAEHLGYPVFYYNPDSKISFDRQMCLFYMSYSVEYLQGLYGDQLASGDIRYTDNSNRLWSPVQNLRREVRTQLLMENGYTHQYDIVSAAPSLLYQLYQQHNRYLGDLVQLTHIQQLLTNRTQVRQMLSEQTGLSIKQIKTTLTAMFCGAKLRAHGTCALYQKLDKDAELMQQLVDSHWIQNYKREIGVLWQGIRTGLKIPQQLDNSTKWQIYFRLERLVVNHLDQQMRGTGARTFRIHDCLATDQEFDPTELEQSVQTATGFSIQLEHTLHSLATQV